MSAQYQFVETDNCKNDIIVDSAVLVEDGVVWDQGEVEMSLNYASNDITLIENNNESFLTATDGNDTQYFSVLETTNETTLTDLNDIALYTDGADVEISDQQDGNSLDEQENIYAVGTSDDLYAFQIAYDDDGNMQRYRYVLRLNENGLLESVPESVELLPADQEIELPESEVITSDLPESEEDTIKLQARSGVIIKKEEYQQEFVEELDDTSNNNEDPYEELQVHEESSEFYDETECFEEIGETKADIVNPLRIEKVEGYDMDSEFETDNFIENNNEGSDKSASSVLSEHQEELHEGHEEPIEDHEEAIEDHEDPIEDHEDPIQDFEEPIEDHEEHTEDHEEANENESDNEEFQIVDGVHVTADTDSNEEVIHAMTAYVENDTQHAITLHENVLQNTDQKANSINNKMGNKVKSLMYYVIKHPEKENVGAITQHVMNNKVIKTNPRSVLKSSYAFFDQKKEKDNAELQPAKIDKKPVKNRENGQARILHNYIAKTTILHAPVRQERLPRKQTIKPVTRADEEIIVQEVVVSSNGIIETSEDGIVKSKVPLKPTEFMQVTDSDEDYDVKREQKRKKKRKKRKSKVPEIVISDSEDEVSDDIVQIDLSMESDQEKERSGKDAQPEAVLDVAEINSLSSLGDIKRKRGRPRKRLNSSLSESTGDTSTSSKKFKSSNDSESTDLSPLKSEIRNIKTNWKCDSCPKVFPSQGGLKTHMQYHTYHEPNNSKKEFFKKPLSTISKPNNHKCLICHEVFKNNYLLTKHTKEHYEANKFECGICKKLFSDQLQLTNHKRSHVKEQMFNSTTLPKHSPKRKSFIKVDVASTDSKYKCTYCTKVFSTQYLLNAHMSTHKRFTCLSCTANFISKLALEDHVQNSCVKKTNSSAKRLLFKTKKTPVRTTPRRLSLRKSVVKTSDEASSSSSDKDGNKIFNPIVNNLKCDSCSEVFKSHKNLFRHKVSKHGLQTPDKNINKSVRKELKKFTSVLPSSRLQNALANRRTTKS